MNKINPKKLLNSKWTSVNPINKEKHFLITQVEINDEGDIEVCVIEAVMTHRAEAIDWHELKDSTNWLQGWK